MTRLQRSGLLQLAPPAVWRRPPGLAVLLIASVILGFPSLQAQAARVSEYEVKAAYLYNFGSFVEWPTKVGKGDSFAVCVLGKDPFGAALDATVAGEVIGDAHVVAKRLSTIQDLEHCRILFISSSEESQLREILAALDKQAVLTVSDLPQFIRRGGMVQFVLDGNRVRFEVNVTSAERSGLTLSSQLLKLAMNVRKGTPLKD